MIFFLSLAVRKGGLNIGDVEGRMLVTSSSTALDIQGHPHSSLEKSEGHPKVIHTERSHGVLQKFWTRGRSFSV